MTLTRLAIIKTLIENYLKDYNDKKVLSRVFNYHYETIYENVDQDDHDEKYSVSSITVQLFTTPSIVTYLMEEGEAMKKMLSVLTNRFFPMDKTTGMRKARIINKGNKNITSACMDLSYCLQHVPSKGEFMKYKETFIRGMHHYIEMMRLFQKTDNIAFAKYHHVDTEPNWENGITFIMYHQKIWSRLIDWSSIDPDTTERIIHSIISVLNCRRTERDVPAIINSLSDFELLRHNVWGELYHILLVDINNERKVGIHHILSRFLIELLCRYDFNPTKLITRNQIILYCAETLAAQALVCQQRAGYWKKNGQTLTYMMYYYTNSRIHNVMAIKDIKALQYMCSTFSDPDGFVATMLNALGLNANKFWDVNGRKSTPMEDSFNEIYGECQ